MESQEKVFKTNINCNNCLSKVGPKLDQLEGLVKWSVDLTHADRLLSATGSAEALEQLDKAVASAGFKAEVL